MGFLGILGVRKGIKSDEKIERCRFFFWLRGIEGYRKGHAGEKISRSRRDLGASSRDLGALWGLVSRSLEVKLSEGEERGFGRFDVVSFVNWVE